MTDDEKDRRISDLEGAIAGALAAMDKGEWGQVRRILKTGRDAVPMSNTGVIAKDAGHA